MGHQAPQAPKKPERSDSRRELVRNRAQSAAADTDHYKQLQESDGV
jgi:hypothetical protein